jgi:hypothetical protein
VGGRLHYLDNMRAMAFSMMLLFHTLKLFAPEGWGIHLTYLPGAQLGAAFSISIKRKNIFTRTAKKLLPMLIIGTPILVATANYLHERYTNPDAVLWSYFATYFGNVLKGQLSDGFLKICAIFIIGYALAYLAGLAHRMRRFYSNKDFTYHCAG